MPKKKGQNVHLVYLREQKMWCDLTFIKIYRFVLYFFIIFFCEIRKYVACQSPLTSVQSSCVGFWTIAMKHSARCMMGDYALVQLTRGYYGYVSYVCRNVVATTLYAFKGLQKDWMFFTRFYSIRLVISIEFSLQQLHSKNYISIRKLYFRNTGILPAELGLVDYQVGQISENFVT